MLGLNDVFCVSLKESFIFLVCVLCKDPKVTRFFGEKILGNKCVKEFNGRGQRSWTTV